MTIFVRPSGFLFHFVCPCFFFSIEHHSAIYANIAKVSLEYADNINLLSSAAEEMSVTIQEIAGNTERAHLVSTDGVTKAEKALSVIRALGDSALEINKVTQVITDISEQINLLSLNATIEAARAGGVLWWPNFQQLSKTWSANSLFNQPGF